VPAVTRVKSHPALLHELERKAAARKAKRGSRAAVELWADLLTDRGLLLSLLRNDPEMPVSEADILEAHRIMVTRVQAIVGLDPRDRAAEKRHAPRRSRRRDEGEDLAAPGAWAAIGLSEGPRAKTVDADLPEGVRRFESERDEVDDDENVRGEIGIDGQRTEDDQPLLDADDLAILVRANQLVRPVENPLAHLFVDEAQDLSPMKLAALIGQTRSGPTRRLPSLTLAATPHRSCFWTTDSATGGRSCRIWAWTMWPSSPAHRLPVDLRDPGTGPLCHGALAHRRAGGGQTTRRPG